MKKFILFTLVISIATIYFVAQPTAARADVIYVNSVASGSNTASAGISTDFEGDPRITDGDHIPGSIVDMGVDEYYYGCAVTISSSTGGSVTTPGEGVFPYEPGTIVSISAQNEPGYTFINWTGDTGTIDDVNSSDTIIMMNDDYSIAANFESVLVNVSIYVDLQGDSRPNPLGWQIPVNVGFYPANSGTLVMSGSSPYASYHFSGTTAMNVVESVTRAYFICPMPIASGTYDITVDSTTTLLNVKRSVPIL